MGSIKVRRTASRWIGRGLVAGAVLAAAGWGPVAAGSAVPRNSSPPALLAAATAAAMGEGSLHYAEVTTSGPHHVTIIGDVTQHEGRQTIVAAMGSQVGHITVVLTGDSAYFKADEPGLLDFMGMPATFAAKYAGTWISVSPRDPGFAAVSAALTIPSVIGQITPVRPLSRGGHSDQLGQPVTAINGFQSEPLPGSAQPLRVPVRLFIRAQGRPLPVLYTSSTLVGKQKVGVSVTVGDWGERVVVSPPSGAVSVRSLSGPPVPA